MVQKKVTNIKKKGKLVSIWEGPYMIMEKLNNRAYKLENLEGIEMPRAWNVESLIFYYIKICNWLLIK